MGGVGLFYAPPSVSEARKGIRADLPVAMAKHFQEPSVLYLPAKSHLLACIRVCLPTYVDLSDGNINIRNTEEAL